MKSVYLVSLIFLSFAGCAQNNAKPTKLNKPAAQDINVGGRCEGCEAIYESPQNFDELNETDTLPDFDEPGPKLLVSGTIYQRDGKTPAPGVILYIYHTDQQGNYSVRNGDPAGYGKGWGKRHGSIRGWMKTGADGTYRFFTLVPASYPNSRNPKHIHPTIKEPGKTAYWIDEFVFDDDPLLPAEEKNRPHPRGSNGVLKTEMKDGILQARRDIILGSNVENYPVAK